MKQIDLTNLSKGKDYKETDSFNVIIYDNGKFKPYDIIPYLTRQYEKKKMNFKNKNELKAFILNESMYQWWSRCEYEVILQDWPNQTNSLKIDIYQQILMNIDIITDVLYRIINK